MHQVDMETHIVPKGDVMYLVQLGLEGFGDRPEARTLVWGEQEPLTPERLLASHEAADMWFRWAMPLPVPMEPGSGVFEWVPGLDAPEREEEEDDG